MLLSIALILISGISLSHLCQNFKLPGLLGMLAAGMILGPFVLNLIDPSILSISSDIRKIALIIILTKAGLTIDMDSLKKIGRPALMMCFIPASFEIIAFLLLAPYLLGLSLLDSAILGSIMAAVSPAVVVPRMIKIIEEGYGNKKHIGQIILAGASLDDIYVIVIFSSFIKLSQGEALSPLSFLNIPLSIIFGLAIGMLTAYLTARFFKKFHMRDTLKVLIVLSISFILVSLENAINSPINFSALIAIIFIGIGLKKYIPDVGMALSVKYAKLWVVAEIFLFVLVGAIVDISYLPKLSLKSLLIIIFALAIRMLGVFICLIKTGLKTKEKLFTMLAYTPKATVQAAIGAIPLSLGLDSGQTILGVAVLAIVLTAPLGAFCIDISYKRFLDK